VLLKQTPEGLREPRPDELEGKLGLMEKAAERVFPNRTDLCGDLVVGHNHLRDVGHQRRFFQRLLNLLLKLGALQ
jgi:hypothetical protein